MKKNTPGSIKSGAPKVKMTDERGHVWQQVQLINAASKKAAEEEKPAPVGEPRRGNMGTCAECKKAIHGVLIQIGDKDLHPECHCCKRCKRMFEDGETFCRDNSKHTVCNACWEKEHEKKVRALLLFMFLNDFSQTAGKPDVQSDIQEVLLPSCCSLVLLTATSSSS